MSPLSPRLRSLAFASALTLALCLAYARVGGFGFVDLDDGAYVYDNPAVREGLSLDGVRWAFTATHSANWHPLTWLAHMLDVSLFGLVPAGHHWTSVLLHAANAVLVFLVLRTATGKEGRSAFAAALFGLHPLRVESVAWIAERKDLLCACFFLLAVLAWTRHVQSARLEWKLAALAFHGLALLAKPMAVTLPAVLLVLDFWPLARSGSWKSQLAEKLPFCVLAFLSSYVTWAVQAAGAATGSLATFPLGERLANAVVAYATYLGQTLWPAGLAAFYPHPSTLGRGIALGPLALSAGVLAVLSFAAWRERTRRPYLLAGWLAYLGMLVPVLGLVQVGSQAHADRYTYLPGIGLCVALAWGAGECLERRPAFAPALYSLGAGVLLASGVGTWIQTGHWRNGDALYLRATRVEPEGWLAWNNLGNQHLGRGELDPARRCFEEAVRLFPGYAAAHYNLGNVHLRALDREAAIAEYERALELDDSNLDAWNNLGVACLNLQRPTEAILHFESALRRAPRHADALENLALACALSGERARCAEACRRLGEVDPARAARVEQQLGLAR